VGRAGEPGVSLSDPSLQARALVLRDLEATGVAGPDVVSLLEEAVSQRRWWAEEWPEGSVYVAGLVAQDVQDALLDRVGRWPLCPECDDHDPHALYVHPEIGGPDPTWVCERAGCRVAPLGWLAR
jgi:hypothetical protein